MRDMCIYLYIYIYINICKYIYIYIYKYIFIYTQRKIFIMIDGFGLSWFAICCKHQSMFLLKVTFLAVDQQTTKPSCGDRKGVFSSCFRA